MRRTMLIFAALTFAFALMGAGCGSDEGDGEAEGQVGGEILMVELEEQNDSGESGTAELRGEGGQTIVEISLDGAPAAAQPAHIHKGTCANLDPEPAYALPNLVDGVAGDTVAVSLDELLDGEYAVNIHRSVDQADLYTACADITE